MVDGFWPAQGAGAPATIYEMASSVPPRLAGVHTVLVVASGVGGLGKVVAGRHGRNR